LSTVKKDGEKMGYKRKTAEYIVEHDGACGGICQKNDKRCVCADEKAVCSVPLGDGGNYAVMRYWIARTWLKDNPQKPKAERRCPFDDPRCVEGWCKSIQMLSDSIAAKGLDKPEYVAGEDITKNDGVYIRDGKVFRCVK
jgi:hypothetical protein